VHRQPDTTGDAMKRRKDRQPRPAVVARPPEYVIVIAASDWSKEHYPANRANLWDALHAGEDPRARPRPRP
jgi:hypothetical protein